MLSRPNLPFPNTTTPIVYTINTAIANLSPLLHFNIPQPAFNFLSQKSPLYPPAPSFPSSPRPSSITELPSPITRPVSLSPPLEQATQKAFKPSPRNQNARASFERFIFAGEMHIRFPAAISVMAVVAS